MRRLVPLLFLALIVSLFVPVAAAQSGPVLVAEIEGEITRATIEYVKAAIEVAEGRNARAIVVRLDTPGGGLQETLAIQRLFLATSVPVIGWVAPSGVSAWSAGTILLVSTDLAAMAPFTTIGSVQPVTVSGEPVTDSKFIEAIVGSLEEHLRLNGRNESLARAFVEQNLNLNAEEAVAAGATELVADTLADLLEQADGRTTVNKGAVLDLAGAPIVTFEPPVGVAFLAIIANPIVSGLLLILGIYAIIFGVSAPGHGAEIAGIVMIALAILGLGFAVNVVAIFLLGLGIVLLIVEVFTPGFGVFGGAGIVCVVIGTIFLAPVAPPDFLLPPEAQLVILAALLTPTALFGAFLLFAMYKVLVLRKRKPVIGVILGEEAEAVDPIPANGRGYVLFEGEMWLATSPEDIAKGERVVIAAKDGTVLTVKRKAPSPAPPQAT
ncbi:MAG: nodulation protein NfeD [Euryarchaeota archaeon]|nr:nodulation protein NfeD [Euryarchaeota archaeon]